jgi:hypothetical protein
MTDDDAPARSVIAERWPRGGGVSRRLSASLPLLVLAFGLVALFIAVGLVVAALGPDAYSGVDGKFNQDLITTYMSFGRPLVVNALNPLEGLFSQLFPLNIWLNPGFAQFLIFDHGTALIVSTAVFLLSYCLAIYCLARTADLSLGASVVAAQLGAFAFPPLYHAAGLFSNFDLMPGAGLTVALFTLLLCVVLRLREVSWRSFAWGAALSAGLIGYIVFNDPLTMGVMGFSFLVPFAVATLEGRRPAVIALRLSVLATAAAILYAMGLVDYVLAMDHYTARFYLKEEFFRPQTTDFVSALYDFPEAGRTYAFFLSGWLVGLVLCRGRPRVLVWIAALNFCWLLLYGALYLFSGITWFAPLPIYVEEYTLHIAALGAVAGWAALVERVVSLRVAPSAAVAAMLVPALIVGYRMSIPDWQHGFYHEPWVEEPSLVSYLDRIALRDGARFSGTAYVFMLGYRDQQTYVNLWRNSIPTLNEYSQTLTPAYEYFRTRVLLQTKVDAEHMKGEFSPERQFILSRLDARAFQAAGTRFLLTAENPTELASHHGDLHAALRGTFMGGIAGAPATSRTWYVYELPDPNRGQYSPTVIHVDQYAPATLAAMQRPDFDWRREAYVTRPIEAALSPARRLQITIERGAIRVQGEADGTSLVVLPVQYSHCLDLADARAGRLVRADFLLTGLVFEGAIDTRIAFDFGFFHSACRKRDLADLKEMGVAADASAMPLAEAQHPFAVTDLRALPGRLREAFGRLRFLQPHD